MAAKASRSKRWFIQYHYGPGLSMWANGKFYRSFETAFNAAWRLIGHHGGMSRRECSAYLRKHWANQICTPPHGDGYSIDTTMVVDK
jgi:hypothetical protein